MAFFSTITLPYFFITQVWNFIHFLLIWDTSVFFLLVLLYFLPSPFFIFSLGLSPHLLQSKARTKTQRQLDGSKERQKWAEVLQAEKERWKSSWVSFTVLTKASHLSIYTAVCISRPLTVCTITVTSININSESESQTSGYEAVQQALSRHHRQHKQQKFCVHVRNVQQLLSHSEGLSIILSFHWRLFLFNYPFVCFRHLTLGAFLETMLFHPRNVQKSSWLLMQFQEQHVDRMTLACVKDWKQIPKPVLTCVVVFGAVAQVLLLFEYELR